MIMKKVENPKLEYLGEQKLRELNGGWCSEPFFTQDGNGTIMYWYDSEVGGFVGLYIELIV